MFKGRSRGRVGKRGFVQKVPLRGLFSNGVWHCCCDPRLPAQRFQTKNGGRNHGRWFYTCQHAQPNRCNFFLWDDEAKSREAAAVLNNSRTEPRLTTPRTPVKSPPHIISSSGLSTPRAGAEKGKPAAHVAPTQGFSTSPSCTPSKAARASQTPSTNPTILNNALTRTRTEEDENDQDEEEFYDWPRSEDDELAQAADRIGRDRNAMEPPETPRKTPRTALFTTPGKRSHDEMATGSPSARPSTPTTSATQDDDIFTTPASHASTSTLFAPSNGLPSPFTTPAPLRFTAPAPLRFDPKAVSSPSSPSSSSPSFSPSPSSLSYTSSLTTDVLHALTTHHVPLSPDLRDAIHSIGTKHTLYTRGVLKGRDVSRALIATKNERIAELQDVIAGLRAERELNRALIRHLRRAPDGKDAGGGRGSRDGEGGG